jgi:hypothetical protein
MAPSYRMRIFLRAKGILWGAVRGCRGRHRSVPLPLPSPHERLAAILGRCAVGRPPKTHSRRAQGASTGPARTRSTAPLRVSSGSTIKLGDKVLEPVQQLCSNCAATQTNPLKTLEKPHAQNLSVCRHFATTRNPKKGVKPPLQGGGRWFETSIAHFAKTMFCRKIVRAGG